ncbi:MAG TPA: T9SS type A sorting domain-containing protein [Bacteroidia bacterium]|nr:T9SS type A sorting domain-containing protein [Bacteroidia bacterium]
MKKILQLVSLCLLFGIPFRTDAQDWVNKMQDHNASFYEAQDLFYKYYNDYKAAYRQQNGTDPVKVPGYKQFKRWEWFMAPRVYANGKRFNPTQVWQESEKYRAVHRTANAGNWSLIGPSIIPTGGGGAGRLNFVRVHPTDPNTIFVGSPAGGLWESNDGGSTWATATDQLAQVIGCTDLAIDPSNPNVMYLATGDGDGGDTYTVGVLKSTDAGQTWSSTGLVFFMANYRQISKILIDPNNTNTILVASTGGIYRSTDAAATFTQVSTGSFKDMEFKPGDPNTVYAAGGEFYKSTDNGQSWTHITSGLPAVANVSRIAIGVTENDPTYVYLIIGIAAPNYGTEGFYRSTNSGSSFTNVSIPALGNQQWYDLCIAVSPTNKNEIILGGQTDFLKSTNGGASWNQTGGSTHVDYHDVIYTDGTTCYMTSDGGVYMSSNAGGSWTNLSWGLEVSQMYGFGQSTTTPYLLVQGWQDNGTNKFTGANWSHILGGDGMLCFIDRTNDANIFAETQNGGLARSTNGGGTFNNAVGNINETGGWVTPWMQDPVNAGIIYAGFSNVWKSTNNGTSWTKISNFSNTGELNTIEVSPANNQIIWAAKATGLYVTSNGGGSWNAITNIPAGTITAIACSDTDPNKAWITYSGFSNINKVFQTNDLGANWTNLSASLPNVPVNYITYVNGSNDATYIGTDLGIYYKDAGLNVWEPFYSGLPNVIVTQLHINYNLGKIRASTYGRGIWESDLYVPGSYPPSAAFVSNKTKVCPGSALQFSDYSSGSPTSWNWSFPGGSPSTSTLQNPVITYNTPGNYSVTLISTNSNGTDTAVYSGFITVTPSPYNGPSATGAQRCGPGPVTLTASGSGLGNLRWWDAPGGGNIVAMGSSYSPNITSTTTYYVDEDFPNGNVDFTGEFSNAIGAGAFFTANDIRGLYFDVLQPVTINTFDVYPNAAGNRTIEILDSQGNTVIDTTIFLPASPNFPYTVNVDFTLYPGTDYFIKCRGYVDLFRNSSGANYPYQSSLVNITGSNAGSPGYYYFFYNWAYTEVTCNTSRTGVTAEDTCFVGIDELNEPGLISVLPNPSNGIFEISFPTREKSEFTIEIFNNLGELIYKNRETALAGQLAHKVDLSKKASGVYMLKISGHSGSTTRKVIIRQ